MIPTFTGYAIVQFLEKYFDELVDLQYTSKMEDDLDAIAIGDISRKNYLNDFYLFWLCLLLVIMKLRLRAGIEVSLNLA